MTFRRVALGATFVMAVLAAGSARAAVLGSFDIFGLDATTSLSSLTIFSGSGVTPGNGVSVMSLFRESSLGPISAPSQYLSDGWNNGRYLRMNVQADPGVTLTITNLTFRDIADTSLIGQAPLVESSIDGVNWTPFGSGSASQSVETVQSFTGSVSGNSIQFRLSNFDISGSGTAASSLWGLSDTGGSTPFQVSGTVAIPEPGSLPLLSLLLLPGAALLRRRHPVR